nr:hypothetical protein [Tanacetum cinerariifolium]
DPGENSSQSPSHIDHHYCYECGDSLDGIFCRRSTYENSFTYDSNLNFVDDSPNPPPQPPMYSYEFYVNDAHYGHDCPPQVSFIYNPEQINDSTIELRETFQAWLQQQVVNLDSYTLEPLQYRKIPIYYDDDDDEESSTPLKDIIISELPPCIAITLILSTKEPNDSLIIRDKHLYTIPKKESDEFIKSSVENLVPNPSESEDLSNIGSDDDESFSDEDVLNEIYSNPLFDEEIISIKIDPHHFNAKSDLIESLLNQDSSIISSSKIDSLLDEFAGELIFLKSIPPGIDEADCDPEEEICLIEKLLYDNSSPHPPEEFNSENSDAIIESFSPSLIPVEDSDSLIEEIDLSLTPGESMPSRIKNDDYDSERDIIFLEEFLSNNSLSLFENESFHFDIPSSPRPPAKPPDDDGIYFDDEPVTGIFTFKVSNTPPNSYSAASHFGGVTHMLAERRYPLTTRTLEIMLSLRLITESASDVAYDLLRFIQKQIDESGGHDRGEKDL